MSEPKPGGSTHQSEKLPSTPAPSSSETTIPDASVPQPAAQPQQSSPPTHPIEDRLALQSRARVFLASPQVQHQGIPAKRAFLAEKGLNETEIDTLLREVPPPAPVIPPRSYPQPPPSNLPVLLLGIVRLFTWLAGGSAVLVLLYQRFLLPRIAATAMARHSIKSHQLSLMRDLNNSLSSLKKTQADSFSVLPRPDIWKESRRFAKCKTIAELVKASEPKEKGKEPELATIPSVSLLRCALREIGKKPTTEELFKFMEESMPWLATEDGSAYEERLWDTLNSCPHFAQVVSIPSSSSSAQPESVDSPAPKQWEYTPPAPVDPPPMITSLDDLSKELPKDLSNKKSPFQHTLQTMSDFTGYLSTQVYMPFRSTTVGMGVPSSDNEKVPLEEELRREIRALKGLVLNRRSFMPKIPRPTTAPLPFATSNIFLSNPGTMST